MSRGVAGFGRRLARAAGITIYWITVCDEWADDLSIKYLATFSDTFATEYDRNSLKFT
jgi:hypothetical protein